MSDTTTPVTHPSPTPHAADDASTRDALVLIVDDNEQNIELLEAYLEPLGCKVDRAADGVEAVERMEDEGQPLPDLVLLDVMMPRMSGFEVCRKIKDDPRTRSVPVMMVTALSELGDIERGVESGTDDFVTKPVNRLELVTRTKSLLRISRLKQDLERTEAIVREMERRPSDEG